MLEANTYPRYSPRSVGAPNECARRLGCVLASAIGDALGHPTELLPSFADIWRKFGANGVQGYMLYWERGGRRFAPYTDDTQMAEVVLRTLLEARTRAFDLDDTMQLMARRFVEWSLNPQGGHRSPGKASLSACAALARGVAWYAAGDRDAAGCGSVVRSYPFGLVFCDDVRRAEEWAAEHSKLTHGASPAIAACAAMAVGTAHALRGEAHDAVTAAMISTAARHDLRTARVIREAVNDARNGVGPETTLTRLAGWAAHECIAAACYIFTRWADDPREALVEAANTPGDSDGIASLVGALVGARCGVGALPESWVWELERWEELAGLAGR
jgi:ADP-ribosylglycohydrolase